eukprot:25580-Prymnesium_polylepis.3
MSRASSPGPRSDLRAGTCAHKIESTRLQGRRNSAHSGDWMPNNCRERSGRYEVVNTCRTEKRMAEASKIAPRAGLAALWSAASLGTKVPCRAIMACRGALVCLVFARLTWQAIRSPGLGCKRSRAAQSRLGTALRGEAAGGRHPAIVRARKHGAIAIRARCAGDRRSRARWAVCAVAANLWHDGGGRAKITRGAGAKALRRDLSTQLCATDKAGRATVGVVVFKSSDGKLSHRDAVKVGVARLVIERRLAFRVTIVVARRARQAVQLALDSVGHPVARGRWQYEADRAQSELKGLALAASRLVTHEVRFVAKDDLRAIDENRAA